MVLLESFHLDYILCQWLPCLLRHGSDHPLHVALSVEMMQEIAVAVFVKFSNYFSEVCQYVRGYAIVKTDWILAYEKMKGNVEGFDYHPHYTIDHYSKQQRQLSV
jgi:hypothetical protein